MAGIHFLLISVTPAPRGPVNERSKSNMLHMSPLFSQTRPQVVPATALHTFGILTEFFVHRLGADTSESAMTLPTWEALPQLALSVLTLTQSH